MSTSRETELINLLSRWLAGHVSNEDLRREIDGDSRTEAAEVRDALDADVGRGDLERTVREALESLALH